MSTLTHAKEMELIKEQQDREEHLAIMEKGFRVADVFINRPYLDEFSSAEILRLDSSIAKYSQNIQIYKITKIVFDKDEDVNDKLTSVYNSLYNLAVTVSVFIVGRSSDVSFFIATRSERIGTLGGKVLESTLKSNFPGIEIEPMDDVATKELLAGLGKRTDGLSMLKGLTTVSLIPSLRNKDKKEQYVQGMEKFINTLRGKSYVAIFLATPLSRYDITVRKHGYEELCSSLSPHAKLSLAYGKNISHAVSKGMSTSFTRSVNESVSNSNSTSSSNTEGRSKGYNSGSSFSNQGWSFNSGSSDSSSSSYTSGTSFSHSVSNSVGRSEAASETSSDTDTLGSSETTTLTFENKGISDLIKKIEDQLDRINQCESYGLWESCAYFFSDDIAVSVLAATTYKALMSGEDTGIENAHVNVWNSSGIYGDRIASIMDHVRNLVHPSARIAMPDAFSEYQEQFVTPTSLVSGKELSFLLGMPRRSVAGLAVQEMAEFGRTVVYENRYPARPISIGNIYHMGIEETADPVNMDLEMFSSHCFITGSSGSGKSYATYNLLDRFYNNDIKTLIIEPTKGEYKMVFGNLEKVNIFSTDINTYRLLRINPFQFPNKIHILSHIEQLMQIFSASWSLYDAMPAILKASIVQAYVKLGWDINNSLWVSGISARKYPVFEDVLDVLPKMIDKSDYSAEIKGNYKGALTTRVQAMTTGLNGLIFRKNEGLADKVLFDENTIIDLSEVGSEETIALIMGTLIMRLGEYRRSQRKTGLSSEHDSSLRHITVLEEAHNLLKRTNKDQSQDGANIVGRSVEMISNSIKEMRTYGEGFLIIDQSPLAVDSSVVENTATKIIMNTPSKDACAELGSALSLEEDQIKELSRLNVGVAAVMQKGWTSPVLMKVGLWDSTKYEARLQYADLSPVNYVRSCLATELFHHIKEDRYSVKAFGDIIRNSNLNKDRKEELSEITERYKNFKNKSIKLTEQMLGILYLEIIGCEELFNIIPQTGLYSDHQLALLLDDISSYDKKKALYDELIANSQQWINIFYTSLEQYVSLEQEVKHSSLRHMLSVLSNSGSDIHSVFGQLYNFLSWGQIK